MIPFILKDLCVLCGKCVEVCPTQAIVLEKNGIYINEEFCEECGYCASVCLYNAINISFPLSTNKI